MSNKNYLSLSFSIKLNSSMISASIAVISSILIIFLFNFGINIALGQSSESVIYFPDVELQYNGSTQNMTLSLQYIKNNDVEQTRINNPDFSLYPPFANLSKGQKYIVNPPNEEDVKYTHATIKLSSIEFISPSVKNLEEVDLDDPQQIVLGNVTDLGNQAMGPNGFVLPSDITNGNYILSVDLQYPNGISGVFTNFVRVTG
ncbi:MAG: hypothetical protein M3162_06145 [Thermoproteota archaeon]|nr:hypothetical protein [Thermoproteota archaeon]